MSSIVDYAYLIRLVGFLFGYHLNLLVAPLPQPLPLLHSVNKSIRYCGIQLLWQENAAVAAAAAAPCERNLKVIKSNSDPSIAD